ncbi:hypothetical protein BD410DRAFT_124087 [Rickenella mellea]|uniref:Uncharacterized protein n=1 Tax=Rickenella mellea TaxID=50990 RepID=A0A4Y7PJZ1_9AGAM|nr:hypothetical protein BD410DRAFT_124087 [Rickenella mellea]
MELSAYADKYYMLAPLDGRKSRSWKPHTYHVSEMCSSQSLTKFSRYTWMVPMRLPPAPLSISVDPFIHLPTSTRSNLTHRRIQSAALMPLFYVVGVRAPSSPEELAHRNTTTEYLSTNPSYHHLLGNTCLQSPEEPKLM